MTFWASFSGFNLRDVNAIAMISTNSMVINSNENIKKPDHELKHPGSQWLLHNLDGSLYLTILSVILSLL